jgi:hypothetical protein
MMMIARRSYNIEGENRGGEVAEGVVGEGEGKRRGTGMSPLICDFVYLT